MPLLVLQLVESSRPFRQALLSDTDAASAAPWLMPLLSLAPLLELGEGNKGSSRRASVSYPRSSQLPVTTQDVELSENKVRSLVQKLDEGVMQSADR